MFPPFPGQPAAAADKLLSAELTYIDPFDFLNPSETHFRFHGYLITVLKFCKIEHIEFSLQYF